MTLKETLEKIKEKLGLSGSFKLAVIGSLIIIILGIILVFVNHALYVAAGYEVGSEKYVFQMTMVAVMGILLPGIILALCIIENWFKKPTTFLTGILVTVLSAFLIVVSIVFVIYAVNLYDPAVAGYYNAIIIMIAFSAVIFFMVLMDGIKNIREGKSSSE